MAPIIKYTETYDCEDRETIESVLDICKNSDIDTNGASLDPTICIKEYQATLYPETAKINGCTRYQYRMDICTHACDPD